MNIRKNNESYVDSKGRFQFISDYLVFDKESFDWFKFTDNYKTLINSDGELVVKSKLTDNWFNLDGFCKISKDAFTDTTRIGYFLS